MRTLLPVLVFSGLTYGCAEPCESPQTLNGRVFDSFTNATTWTVQNEEGFAGVGSPANGDAMVQFDWGNLAKGPVTVTIDGQAFNGNGTWDTQECGNFVVTWGGTYLAEEEQSVHDFVAGARFRLWGDNLEGQIDWAETWSSADGQVGTFEVEGQLRGSVAGSAPTQ
jgi:hypothetical protein